MALLRSLLLTALPFTTILAACGGDDGGSDPGDITPTGEHHTYVAKSVMLPPRGDQSTLAGYSLNLDGKSPMYDNQLGSVLSTLTSMGVDVQGSLSTAVADGSIILIGDLQTESFDSSSAAGFQVKLGENPNPAACGTDEEAVCVDPTPNDNVPPTCTGCQKHLAGGASFSISANSPNDAAVAGTIVGGTFNGGPGKIQLQIALGGADPVNLSLIGARSQITGMSETSLGSVIIAGALPESELNNSVLPAIVNQLGPTIGETCTDPSSPPPAGNCGCESGSTGATVLNLFDGADGTPKDCAITVAEVQANTLIQSLLAPDVEIDGVPALSLGVKVEAVAAVVN